MTGFHASNFIRAVFLGLLVIIITAITGAGCAGTGINPAISSPFPTNRVTKIHIVMQEENWSRCLTNAYAEQYVPADIWINDELISGVGVRPKGNSSLGQAVVWGKPRIPLAVDFNLFNKARTYKGIKKVFLNNGWSDPTLIRECMAYEIFAEMQVPAPRACLVDLRVNDDHLGVYTMAEAIDTTFLRSHFSEPTGNLYKPDILSARLDWTEEDLELQRMRMSLLQKGSPDAATDNNSLEINLGGGRLLDILRALDLQESVAAYTPSPIPESSPRGIPPAPPPRDYLQAMALKTNENNPDHTALFRFLEVLNNVPDSEFVQEIEKVLDVDEALRFLAVSALIVHLDNYIGIGHNNYLYEENGIFHIIPWDLNMAFGTFNNGIRKDGLINFYIDEPTAGPVSRYPLVARLLSHPPYLDKYHGYLEELLNGPFSPEVMNSRINHYASLVRPYAEVDREYFYSPGDWERCLTEDLRPPDNFEGWMAGGPSPMLPWLTPAELSQLQKYFRINAIWDLFNLNLTPADLEKIKACLPPEKYKALVQNLFGPLEAPQPPGQPGFGPNSLGLKTFIAARYESVRQQLNGERPRGTGTGSGNGGSLWMVDWLAMR